MAPDETDDDATPDFVSAVRGSWSSALPGLDTSPLDVLGRISRISALSVQRLNGVLATSGVSRSEFDVLCALARSPQPLRASGVTAQTMLSGAATTKLTARLEGLGLVQRRRLERDGRVVLLSLTEEGRALVEEQFPRCVDSDRRLLAGLDDGERAALAALLRRVAANAERHR
ncbi:MarR family winged helix-turn-helix transcriptional regulator [Sinomonas sp. P10A9]|uniref:MarR family winged helix-turn-helix transcriptional regulator n=1 Tax=Sinomonas puerhi TaxID=3238584 RepID=A0AB39L961_9MICC